MRRKYFNLAGEYIPLFHRCVAEKLWIRTNRHWYGPYDWGYKYGVVFFGMDWEPTLADPYELIAKARQKPLSDSQSLSLEKFEARVDAYYKSGKDNLLLKSIETGLWQY